MQLKIQRSQRSGGVLGNRVIFCLDVRADYSAEEQHNIRRYRLGGEIIYSSQAARRHIEHASAHLDRTQSRDLKEQFSGLARGALSAAMAKMSLNISIASLGRGHHIECKDLEELLQAEETVRDACRNVTRYLDAAATFDGSEIIIEYDKGEEKVHIAQNAPPLIAYNPEASTSDSAVAADAPPERAQFEQALYDMGKDTALFWAMLKQRWLALQGKVVAGAAAKGWDLPKLHLQLAQAAKERWLAFEKAIIDRAKANDRTITPVQLRIACAAVILVVLILLVLLL
jgi:hypothetical protein